jgi:hypothetical protein
MIARAENTTESDLYYEVPLSAQLNGNYGVGMLQNKSFALSTVRNSTGLMNENISFSGNETKFITADRKVLFLIPKGGQIIGKQEFKVKSGEAPVLENRFLFSFRKLEFFQLEVTDYLIQGVWKTSCGTPEIMLTVSNQGTEKTIIQTVNGKQIFWKKSAPNVFRKTNDEEVTLTFNMAKRVFTYVSPEGIVCNWNKRD